MGALLAICSILLLVTGQPAPEAVGSGQTQDGQPVTLYRDGTWKVDQPATNKIHPPTFGEMKLKVDALCSGEDMKDTVIGTVNIWQGSAQMAGISREEYYSCLSQATGCMELTTLAMQCGQR